MTAFENLTTPSGELPGDGLRPVAGRPSDAERAVTCGFACYVTGPILLGEVVLFFLTCVHLF